MPAPPRPAARPGLVAALVVLAAVCFAAVLGLHAVFVGSVTGQVVEATAREGTSAGREQLAGGSLHVLDVISATTLGLAVATAFVIAVLRSRWRSGLAAVALVGGSTATTEGLKHVVLHRPSAGYGVLNTLPSGHTTVAACVAAAAVLVAPRSLRPLLAVLGGAYAVATGVATVVVGWHRPSDAIAAYAVVLGWAALVAAVVVAVSPPAPGAGRPDRAHRLLSVVLGAAAMPVALGAAALLFAVALRVDDPAGHHRQLAAYAGGVGGIVAAGLVLTALWLVIVPVVDDAGVPAPTLARRPVRVG